MVDSEQRLGHGNPDHLEIDSLEGRTVVYEHVEYDYDPELIRARGGAKRSLVFSRVVNGSLGSTHSIGTRMGVDAKLHLDTELDELYLNAIHEYSDSITAINFNGFEFMGVSPRVKVPEGRKNDKTVGWSENRSVMLNEQLVEVLQSHNFKITSHSLDGHVKPRG